MAQRLSPKAFRIAFKSCSQGPQGHSRWHSLPSMAQQDLSVTGFRSSLGARTAAAFGRARSKTRRRIESSSVWSRFFDVFGLESHQKREVPALNEVIGQRTGLRCPPKPIRTGHGQLTEKRPESSTVTFARMHGFKMHPDPLKSLLDMKYDPFAKPESH